MAKTLDRTDPRNLPKKGGMTVESTEGKRNAFTVIVDMNRPYENNWSFKCPTCNTRHFHKAYHIMVNGEGKAVLSPEVYAGVRAARMGATELNPPTLRLLNHTKKPPNQVLGTKGGMMGLVPQRDKTVIYHE